MNTEKESNENNVEQRPSNDRDKPSSRAGQPWRASTPRFEDPEEICPPLPGPIPDPTPLFKQEQYELPQVLPPETYLLFRLLREGCYLIRFTPLQPIPWLVHYDGTLRVQKDGFNTIASGDLYLHHVRRFCWWPWYQDDPFGREFWRPPPPYFVIEPNPTDGIPIFPINRYRYYLRVTKILEWATTENSFTLGFNRWRYDHSTDTWTDEGPFTASMKWTTAPSEYPSGSDYLQGQVKDTSGFIVGTLTMGWVSPNLRRVVVEIDRVAASETATDNGAGTDWQDIFALVGWNLDVHESDTNIVEPSGASWSNAELHAEMLDSRATSNLDAEWRYHLLLVRELDATSRGIHYDSGGTDSNNVPREGAAVASHWVFPNTPLWGNAAGIRFGAATGPYFRTAVHEIGHAMNLNHNTNDNGIMNTTNVIASNATAALPFPTNIQYRHHSDDQKRLRHMPDIHIRPGGSARQWSYTGIPLSPNDMIADAAGLELSAQPLLNSVPIGAPVRVEFRLANQSSVALPVPSSLSMKHGHVRGKVIDPSGKVRSFLPIIHCLEEEAVKPLEPKESMGYAMTLLRGRQGALFPQPGLYEIQIEITWWWGPCLFGIWAETSVMVTPPIDDLHAEAALRILSTPDALLPLVFGGDHMEEGIAAIQAGIENPVLRPHFAFIEAKRLGNRFRERVADLKAAASFIDDTTVMSSAETKRAKEFVQAAKGKAPKEVVKRLSDLIQERESKLSRK